VDHGRNQAGIRHYWRGAAEGICIKNSTVVVFYFFKNLNMHIC
jgi:hypothetical protein